VIAKFIGGSKDGQRINRNTGWGRRILVVVDTRTRETYVRDRDGNEHDSDGDIVAITYKLETTERCTIAGTHEGPCKYEVVS
jgi:hypothetical protein